MRTVPKYAVTARLLPSLALALVCIWSTPVATAVDPAVGPTLDPAPLASPTLEPSQSPSPSTSPSLNDLSVSMALGGRDVLEAMRSATTIRAQRVDSLPPGEGPGDPSQLLELAPPFALSAPEIATLQGILNKKETYLAAAKRCRFRANVRYFLGEHDPPLSLVLCFGCGELQVWRGRELVSFSPFDSAYAELLAQAQRLFPNDAFLASFDPSIFEERVRSMRDGD